MFWKTSPPTDDEQLAAQLRYHMFEAQKLTKALQKRGFAVFCRFTRNTFFKGHDQPLRLLEEVEIYKSDTKVINL